MARPQPFLVPISDSNASFEALASAGALARGQRATVRAIHVIEVVRSLPLNAEMEWEARQGEQLLRRAEETAKERDFTVSSDMLQARGAGQAIVDEAHAVEAQAIVMGMRYRKVVGDFDVGITTAYVLQHARCPVWVVREAAHE
jgi:nucleotide-binding universal stress UspA family protein